MIHMNDADNYSLMLQLADMAAAAYTRNDRRAVDRALTEISILRQQMIGQVQSIAPKITVFSQ